MSDADRDRVADERSAPRAQVDAPPCAAIDVGTNTILLLVGRVLADGDIEVLEDHCITARLGEGVAKTGQMQPAAIERALDALRGFRRRIDALGVLAHDVRAVGTAVFRRARNAGDFVARALRDCDVALEVISGDEEARLSHAAVVGHGDPRTRVIDVGGGSTEVIADGGRARVSMPIGALTLTEAHLHGGVATPASWRALELEVERAVRALPDIDSTDDSDVVAVGSTGLNLAALVLGLPAFDIVRAEGARLCSAEAARWAERLAVEEIPQRSRRPIEAERAMILPAGLACLGAALARTGANEFRVSGRGLRFGVLREIAVRRR